MTKKQDTDSDNIKKEDANDFEQSVASAAAELSDDTGATTEVGDQGELQAELGRLQSELEAANAKAAENWEHFVRAKADLENLERRAQRDVENAHKFASEKFLEAMIPVIDSLEMGADAARQGGADVTKLKEGMELTLKMFADALHKFEVKKLDPVGESFNPEFHQAMSLQESAEHPANSVLMVMQKGYLLNERLIRPALVVVSKNGGKKKSDDEANGSKDAKTSSDGSSDTGTDETMGKTVDEKA